MLLVMGSKAIPTTKALIKKMITGGINNGLENVGFAVIAAPKPD